jgi:hypothetical protein
VISLSKPVRRVIVPLVKYIIEFLAKSVITSDDAQELYGDISLDFDNLFAEQVIRLSFYDKDAEVSTSVTLLLDGYPAHVDTDLLKLKVFESMQYLFAARIDSIIDEASYHLEIPGLEAPSDD